jgi:hypothetical protein
MPALREFLDVPIATAIVAPTATEVVPLKAIELC